MKDVYFRVSDYRLVIKILSCHNGYYDNPTDKLNGFNFS